MTIPDDTTINVAGMVRGNCIGRVEDGRYLRGLPSLFIRLLKSFEQAEKVLKAEADLGG